MSTIVSYNGTTITPAPFVGRTFNGLDYGNRWGVEQNFELRGYLTGITGTGAINTINSIFNRQPGTLLVTSAGVPVISGLYTHVDEVSFEQSIYGKGGFVPYSVRLRTYHTPSGVIEPSNRYTFNFPEGDVVSVTHDISAKGVKGSSMALLNAINFVNQFVGKDPYSNCAPFFIQSGSGILTSRQETINRLEGTYNVSETYQYNTGAAKSYVETSTLSINDSVKSDYPSYDLTLEFLGSQIDSNVDALLTSISGVNPLSKIKSIYGYETGNFILNSHGIDINSGENKVVISSSFISGLSGDLSGFFDYTVDMTWDEITDLMTFNVNGSFDSKGVLAIRKQNYDNFKTANGSNYSSYLYDLITGSYLGQTYLTGHPLCPYPNSLNVSDNTGQYDLSISATFDNRDYLEGLPSTNYTVSADASKWLFNLVQSANIEGHYVIQDLNCKSRERTAIGIQTVTSGNNPTSTLETLRSDIYNAVFSTAPFLLDNSISSGEFSTETSHQYIGDENVERLTQSKLASSQVLKTYLRASGQRFGY